MAIRKALLVGINAYASAPLRGCINDVKQVKGLLAKYYGFADADTKVLLEKDATVKAIKDGLKWLAEGGADPDVVRVFHFSGHGYFEPDKNGDEPDGRDECIVPYDYESAGFINDDTLKKLYDKFPASGNLTLLMDCCHSGTVQRDLNDVAYRFLPARLEDVEKADEAKRLFNSAREDYVVEQLRAIGDASALSTDDLRSKVGDLIKSFEKARFGDVRVRESNVLLAGCRDDQQSADAHIAGDYHGAFTYYLADAIVKSNGTITYHDLIAAMSRNLEAGRYAQIPQLECRGGREKRVAFNPFA